MLGALLAAVLVLSPYVDPQEVFVFDDPRIAESSGLASSSLDDGVLFTHNDSGDDARFFAVDLDGRTLATYVLPDVQARDWEDMARGPDEQGRSSLWLGDIGDNRGARDLGILVHRVPEPVVADDDGTVTTPAPTSFRLRYPDSPRDAETLLVHPRTGRLLVVSKTPIGATRVYTAPEVLDPDGPNVLERAVDVSFRTTGTPGGPDIGAVAQVLVTGGDVSPDGGRVALRTYTDLYEWQVPGDDLVAAFRGEPTVTPLPPTEQGEAVAYSRDGTAVYVSSEGEGAPVHRLTAQEVPPPLPAEEPARVPPALVGVGTAVLVVLLLALLARRRGARRRRPRAGR